MSFLPSGRGRESLRSRVHLGWARLPRARNPLLELDFGTHTNVLSLLQSNVLRVARGQLLISRAGSNGRCNTIWYKAAFKGGVYEARETVWAFRGAED